MKLHMPHAFRRDHLAAFERRIASTYEDPPVRSLVHDPYRGTNDLIQMGGRYAIDDWRTSIFQWKYEGDPSPPAADAKALSAVERWLAHGASDLDNESKLLADFRASVRELDGRDNALRAHSTDLGNFIADAVRAASQADLAFINSGSLRGDDTLPAAITIRRMHDVLLYDNVNAAVLLEMPRVDARKMYEHGLSKVNGGASLQVSANAQQVLSNGPADELLRIALVRFMLASETDEDGICQAAANPGEPIDAVRRRLLNAEKATSSLLSWIAQGAAATSYSAELRVAAGAISSENQLDQARFIKMVDAYREKCARCRLQPLNIYQHWMDPNLNGEIRTDLQGFADFILTGYRKGLGAKDRWFTDLYNGLRNAEENYSHRYEHERGTVSYQRFLDECVNLLDGGFFRYLDAK
ncbi:5'-nucleotidase C-terminal domain-containing protein [Paraburkholderia xenovorans]|uniref:5'-nucleotidase C-terminal domain-containing protein n=1 Tax=Paraburkholderia xenovorans TaxID=36873 RepID=UPI0038B8C948